MNLNPTLSSKPLLIIITSWLMIFFGAGLLFAFFFLGMLGGFAANYIGAKNVLIFILQNLLPGLVLLSVGLGLKNMKRWVLYFLPIISLVGLYLTFQDITNGTYVLYTILILLPTIYCWTHRSSFL